MSENWNDLVPPAWGVSKHLADGELAAADLTPAADKHLADCAWCRQGRQALSPDDRDGLAALLEQLDRVEVPKEVVQAASALALPGALIDALHTDQAEWPQVAPAQLWRLSWRGLDMLAVVLQRETWWARVAPLTTDVALADEYTYLAGEPSSILAQRTAIFLRATATVPLYTLSWYLGRVASSGNAGTAESLRRLEIACLQQSSPPADLPTGPPLAGDDWDRLEALETLSEQMGFFEAATHGIMDESGPIAGRVDAGQENAEEASTLLRQRGVELRSLMAGTGLPAGRLTDWKSGHIPPSAEERTALTRYFHVPVKGGGHPENERLALFDLLCEPAHRNDWFASPAEPGTPQPEDRLVPFMEHLLDHPVAARTVTTHGTPGRELSREEWRNVWRDRLAINRRDQG